VSQIVVQQTGDKSKSSIANAPFTYSFYIIAYSIFVMDFLLCYSSAALLLNFHVIFVRLSLVVI